MDILVILIAIWYYDLFKKYLPSGSERLAALASIIDYCPEQARDIIDKAAFAELDVFWNIFLSIQYIRPLTNTMLDFLLKAEQPDELLKNEFFLDRSSKFKEKIKNEKASVNISSSRKILFHRLNIDNDLRIASPLATIISEKYPDKISALCEDNYETGMSRISFRNRKFPVNIGVILKEICSLFERSDGVGHEKAASIRCPIEYSEQIIELFEKKL